MSEYRKRVKKWVHGQELAIQVDVEQVFEEGDPWSPYLEPSEVAKLDAADAGDISRATKLGRVFRLTEVASV